MPKRTDRNKYGAQPTVVDGIRFASKAEARRYGELKLLEKAGEVEALTCHPSYQLTVDNRLYPDNGLGRSATVGHYVADFGYRKRVSPREWQHIVEDVKGGPMTALAKWKIKHFEFQFGCKVTLIRYRR